MKNLVYKELSLSINKFFYIMPLLLSLLFFIPQWIFSFVFMYFFWISMPQIYSAYLAQADYSFTSMLPVTKKEIVQSKAIAMFALEGIHIAFGVIFGIINNILYGTFNFMMDINPAFFGLMFIVYGLFNIIFLPGYFKTAYRFGKPLLIGVAVTLVFAGFFEYGVLRFKFISDIIESNSMVTQISLLGFGIVVFVILSFLAVKKSIYNYENIK